MPEKSLSEIPREVRPLFTKAQDALGRDNFDYAIELLMHVVTRAPEVVEVRKALRKAQQGKAAAKGGGFFKKMFSSASATPVLAKAQLTLSSNPVEAMLLAEQVLNADANNGTAHKIIVQAAAALDLPQTALLSLEILWEHNQKDKDITIQLADFLTRTGQVKVAEKLLIDLRAAHPTDADVHQALKNCSAKRTLREGGYQAAEAEGSSYRQMLRNEAEAQSLEQEQRTHKSEDVNERLIREYEQRLKTEGENPRLLRSLAELHTQRKQFDRALEWYARLKATEAGNDAALDQAVAQVKLKQLDAQREQLDPLAPDFAEATKRLEQERLEFQLSECQRRVEKYPTDLNFRFELGTLYFQAGKISEAQKEFQKAQSNPHKRIAAMNYLAQCFAKRKIYDLAASALEDAIKEKPGFDDEKKELIYNLGGVYESMGQKEAAIEQFKQIYKVDTAYRDVEAKVDAYYAGQ